MSNKYFRYYLVIALTVLVNFGFAQVGPVVKPSAVPASVTTPTKMLPSQNVSGVNVITDSLTSRRGFHATMAAPANDNFANATTLTINAALVTGSNYGGTLESGENLDCQNQEGNTITSSVWYKFTAAATTTYYVNLNSNNGTYYTGLSVWQTTSLPTGSCHPIQCNANSIVGFLTYSVALSVTSGTVYYIQVSYPSSTDTYDPRGWGAGNNFKISVKTTASYAIINPLPLNTISSAVSSCYLNTCSPNSGTASGDIQASPCGGLYIPSSGGASSTATAYPDAGGLGYTGGYIPYDYAVSYYYSFTNANVSGSAAIQALEADLNTGGCGVGNCWWEDWTLYNSTGTSVISCGNIYNTLTISGVACTGSYILYIQKQQYCWDIVNALVIGSGPPYYGIIPYAGYPSCSPPACSPTPIQLLYFRAEYEEATNSVMLHWATASEINNKLFTVQRSIDGNNWQDVTTAPGAGTATKTTLYIATDEQPYAGDSYYRLMQTDYDGTTSYSDPQIVSIPSSCSVTIFPNPTKGNLNLRYGTDSPDPLNVKVMDVSGHQVATYTVDNIQKGINDYSLPTSKLEAGMYFIQISNAQKTFYEKFVKQ